MRLVRTLGLAAGLAAAVSMALAGGASAKPLEHATFHNEGTFIDKDFCDVPGLRVQQDNVADIRALLNSHGPDGLVYFHANIHVTTVYTNLANGNTVTEVGQAVDKDLRVTDNGDGTLTILVLSTGNIAVFGPDGKALARNPGQVRVRCRRRRHADRPVRRRGDRRQLRSGEGIDRQDRRLLRSGPSGTGTRSLTNGRAWMASVVSADATRWR